MKTFAFVAALVALVGLRPVQSYAQAVSCEGHEVQPPPWGDDILCHFEDEFCGTPYGTIGFCPGSWGSGVCTEGGGYIEILTDKSFAGPMIEIECQVMFTQLPGPGENAAGLITKYVNGDPVHSEFGLFVEGNTMPPSWELAGDGTDVIHSNGGIEVNVLYCVRGWICRNGIGEIWVNNQRVATGWVHMNDVATDTPVVIGNSHSGENYFHGMIDEVRMGTDSIIGTEEATWGSIKEIYR